MENFTLLNLKQVVFTFPGKLFFGTRFGIVPKRQSKGKVCHIPDFSLPESRNEPQASSAILNQNPGTWYSTLNAKLYAIRNNQQVPIVSYMKKALLCKIHFILLAILSKRGRIYSGGMNTNAQRYVNLLKLPEVGFIIIGIGLLFLMAVPTKVWGQSVGDYQTTTGASGNWNTVANWETFDGTSWVLALVAPSLADGAIEVRNDANITSSSPLSIDQLTVNGTFISEAALAIQDGTGTDLQVNGTFQTSAAVSINSGAIMLVAGTCQINSNGFFYDSPTYSAGSTLIYNTTSGSYNVSNEWTGNSTTAGIGVPYNITIQNTNIVNTPGGSVRGLAGSMNISSGGITLNNDLYVGGNWTVGATASQINNSKAVYFNAATGDQTITKTGGGTVYFDYLIIDKATSGNLLFSSSPATDVTINSTSGQVLQILNTGNLDLNGNHLNLNNTNGVIYVNGAGTITSGISGGVVAINGNKTVANNSGTGTLTFGTNVTVQLHAVMDFGFSTSSISTILGTLEINLNGFVATGRAPIYGPVSTLLYNSGNIYTMGDEWYENNIGTGPGVPQNVTVAPGSSLYSNGTSFKRQLRGNLTLNTPYGSNYSFYMSSLSGGDLEIAGNWINNTGATFYPNGRQVIFMGYNNAQTISGSTNFDYLKINNTYSSDPTVTLLGTSSSVAVSTELDLTSGILITNTNILTVDNSSELNSIINGSSSSYINGNLKRSIGETTGPYIFPIGTSSAYASVTINFVASPTAGYLQGSTNDGDNGSIGTSYLYAGSSVNRTWTFTASGGLVATNYDATFNWVAGDQDPTFLYNNAKVGRFSSSIWSYPIVGTRNATDITVTGLTDFGTFQVADGCILADVPTVSANANPVCNGGSSVLSIASGILNDATAWKWYTGSCGGTLIGSGNSITVTPATTTTYYVRGEGGCTLTSSSCAQVTVTVDPNATINLTSAVGTDAQSPCVNTAITDITYAIGGGGTGASITVGALPAGVTGSFSAGVFTISGTPTATGTFNYTVTTTGACTQVSASGTITVTPNNTITLSSAAGTDAQTRCINTAITNITYTTTGATGATFSGLPTGVTGAWATPTVTISGIPSTSGTFNYTITLTDGCGTVTKNGSIIVNPNNTITLTSAAGTDNQNPACLSTPITIITYSTTGATGASVTNLPTGVTGVWASNVVTISGTPTATGNKTYTVTLTGGCGIVTTTGTINVLANMIAGSPSAKPTLCINTALTPITHTTNRAFGITNDGISGANGLPAGVSAHFTLTSPQITISGTPTVAGTYNYIIPLTGGCGIVNATGTITVTPNMTVTAGSTTTLCINTALPAITHTTTLATGITSDGTSGANGLPAGVSAHYTTNTITISGTPTVSGVFNYNIPLTGGCGTVNATGTITVGANMTVTAGSTTTLCINNALPAITHTTTIATGITSDGVSGANGLPAGVSAHWAGNTITISGTPTAPGIFSYSIPLTGGCGTVNATGTITVTANMTVTAASYSPTLCPNTALSPAITHTTTLATGISNNGVSGANGLPNGVSATWTGNTITISGTPTASGTFNYSISLTGGCGSVSATGTITVNPTPVVTTANTAAICSGTGPNIALTATVASSFTWTIGTIIGGITGASPGSGLTINQTLTNPGNASAGTVEYLVTPTSTTGSCIGAQYTITVTVNPTPVVTNASAATICSDTKPDILLTASAASSFTWTIGIANNVTGANAGSGPRINEKLTNTGNATDGTVEYIVTPTSTTGSCIGAPYTITITVNPTPVVTNASTAAVCSNTVPNITFTATTPSSFTWSTGAVTGGITGMQGDAGPILNQMLYNPSNITSGTVEYLITPTSTAGSCAGSPFTMTLTVKPISVLTGPAPALTMCSGAIFSYTPSSTDPATTYTWTRAQVTGITPLTGSGSGAISEQLFNSTSNPLGIEYVYILTLNGCTNQQALGIAVIPAPTATATASLTTICAGQSTSLSSTSSLGTSLTPTLIDEQFNLPTNNWTLTNNSQYGTPGPPAAAWTLRPDNYNYVTWDGNPWPELGNKNNLSFRSNDHTQFYLTNSDAQGYVIVNRIRYSNTETYLQSPVMDTRGYSTLQLSFWQYYLPVSNDHAYVEVSTNGTTWIAVQTYNTLQGAPTAFVNPTINLTGYVGNATFYIRFHYSATWDWFWAIDNVKVTGTSPSTGNATWTSSPAGFTFNGPNPGVVSPTVSTRYIVTYTDPGSNCPGTGFVDVTVNPKPAINPISPAASCSPYAFSVTPANGTNGIVPAGTTYTWTAPVSSPLGAITGGSAQATGQNSISQTLTNTTNASATLTYTVTPTSGSCPGATFTVTVTVNPKPAINPISPAASCSPYAFSVTPVNGTNGIVPAGTTYTWTAPVSSPLGAITGGSAQATGQNSISQTLTNTTNASATLTYTVTPTSGSCPGATFTVTVTVNPKPAINPISPAASCSPYAFSVTPFNVTNGIVPAGTTYTWTAPVSSPLGAITGGSAQATGQNSISQTLTNTTNASATLTYTVTPTSGGCTGATFTVTVTVNPKPAINPISLAASCSPYAFSVTPVNGTNGIVPAGTTYTWIAPVSSPLGAITGGSAQATGQNSISQTLTNTTNASATLTYTVTPTSGGCTGTTFTVTVTVNPKPAINPISPAASCSPYAFSVTPANGTNGIVPAGTTYTWIAPVSSPLGAITGGSAQATGQNSISQTLTNTTNASATLTYTVTPTSGGCTGATFTVTITVSPKPNITTSFTATSCSPYAFSVTPVNGTDGIVPSGTTYTWLAPVSSPLGAITGGSAQAIGQNSISQTLTNTTNASATLTYTVTPTSGGCIGATFTVTVTVNPKPAINPITPAASCSPYAFSVTPVNGTNGIVPAGTTYTWTAPVSSPLGAITGGSAQATGQNSISQTLTNTTNASATLTYTVTPTSGSCTGATFTVTATVNPKPAINPISPAASCSPYAFSVTPANGTNGIVPAGTTYTWVAPVSSPLGAITGGSAQATGQNSISQTLTNTTNASATLTYTVTPTSGGCTGTTFTVTVTVSPKPNITTSFTVTSCSPYAFSVTPVNGTDGIVPSGTTYTWTAPVSSPLGAITGGSAQATGQNSISQTLTNTTNASATLTYTVTPTSGGCTGATFTVTVTVNPKPAINPISPAASCSPYAFSVTPVNGTNGIVPAGTTYTWVTPVSSPLGAITGGSAQATGQNSISQTLTNATNASATLTYTVTPTSGSCTGATFTVTVTVNPIPTITATSPGSTCGPGTVTLGATASVGTISWFAVFTGGAPLGTGTSFTTPNISATTTYYVEATSNGCTTGSRTAIVATVNDIPAITGTTPASLCGTGSLTLGATASAGTINWYSAASGGSSLGTGLSYNTPSISATTIYYVDATSNGCISTPRTAVIATINDIPSIQTFSGASICGSGTLTLSATPSAGIVNWYAGSTGGSSLGTGTSFTTPVLSATTIYYADATSNGCTTASRTPITAKVTAIPTITSTTPGITCVNGTVTLGATASAGTIKWYTVPTGGASLGSGISYTTPSLPATTTYYIDATAGVCITPSRTAVVATVGNLWKGATPDWSIATNWNCGVPSSSTDIIIPSSPSGGSMPVIGTTITADCRNIEIQPNATLTIQSDATSSGSLIVNGTSTVNGTVTYIRDVTSAYPRWYIISPPVSGSALAQFQSLLTDNGTTYDFGPYVEPNNDGWDYSLPITNTPAYPLTSGQGYVAQLASGNNNISFAGGLNGTINLPVTSTGQDNGWNAVGNPFPSAIGITNISTSAQNFLTINDAVLEDNYKALYLWYQTGTYTSGVDQYYHVINNSGYTGNPYAGNDLDNYVQAGQGFLINVKAPQSGDAAYPNGTIGRNITFSKGIAGMQVHSQSTTMKSKEISWPGLTLLATNNGRTRSSVVAFNENMTTGLDASYDAGLLAASEFNLYTHLVSGDNETDFAVQCLPDEMYDSLAVPVGIDFPWGGNITFKAAGVILPEGVYPVIEDRLMHVNVPLKTESDSLTVTIAEPTWGIGRFYLHFGGKEVVTGKDNLVEARSFTAYYGNQKITLFGTPEQGTKVWLYDINGKRLSNEYTLTSANRNEIPAAGLANGIYLLRLEGKTTHQSVKITVLNK